MNLSEIDIELTPVFYANKRAYESGGYSVIVNQGGTRSSKTYSIIQLLITIALQQSKQISIVSPSLPHLKRGARKDFIEIMESWQLFKENDFNRSDNVYHFPVTKAYIEFFGVDDPGKVRGPGRDILFINEANLTSESTYIQLALRTKEVKFIDFNPIDEYSWVYNIADAPGNKLIHSCYKNNLAYLSQDQVAEIEKLKDADDNLWKVFGLGLRGTNEATIYTHWKQCEKLPGKGEQWYGQDFGYNVPSALIKVEYYEGAIYAEELIYETKLTTSDLIEQYKLLNIDRNKEIFCDAAEPKTIEEIHRAKFNVKPADKDVWAGIQKVKSMPLYVTASSTNLIKELRSYKWKTDKDGNITPDEEPVKMNDHGCDGLRYAIFTKLTKPKRHIGVLQLPE